MKSYLVEIINNTSDKLEYLKEVDYKISVPNQNAHGDYSINAAMLLSKKLNRNPREIAQEIINNIEYDINIISKIEIAGPGFINFFFNPLFVVRIINDVLSDPMDYGKLDNFKGKKANVEFVSANPTGPLTVGHGRNAVVGDTISNMLEWIGYEVDREFYFNNAGRQMRVLGDSVKKRYLALLYDDTEDFPEDYYQGEYIIDIAEELKNEFGDKLIEESPEGIFKQRAEKNIFADIENTLDALKIKIKIFFNENSLYEDGKIDDLLSKFKEMDISYENEGAVWLRLKEMGNEQDKVIIKSTGEPTYRLPDIAYHTTKFDRGYDLIVDIFGSDHNATYPDVVAALKAMGYDTEKIKVVIYQFVTIMEGNEKVKMSTRKANFITLDELINEVGPDVVRYFFIMQNTTTHLNFDLELAKKHSDENPVFYLQYAHARISSILKVTHEQGLKLSTQNLELLVTESELNILKKLSIFKEEILYSAIQFEPHRIAVYLLELAGLFHKFYNECRIIGSENKLAEARIALVTAVQIVIRNGLRILGVTAPEKM
ncbi:MAG: arginine--tRNA ligase [Bacteroidetes bacterium]|nr:arginine--tRNA ligase [Bacteroidota bacterium]